MTQKSKLFIIPSYLSEQHDASFLAPMVLDVIKHTEVYFVENVRTTRRFISSLKLGIDISELEFEVLDKKTSYQAISTLFSKYAGKDVGVVSEAGLPGLADPGGVAIGYAQKNGIKVIPLPGASSIQTALIASGLNGQKFSFNGYLPINKTERIKSIKQLEQTLSKSGFTQIFMETPFRNMSLFTDLLENLSPNTYLHLSSDLFGESEKAETKTVAQWKKQKIDLHKIPTVFCIGNM
ncbi:MAG: SAM-dependent methyltransferase [Cyclobacteriaceae bacterium]